MAQPKVFVRTGMKRNLVYQLLRSIYGLKQATCIWNQKIHTFLIKIGFLRSNIEPCLYIDIKRNIYITILVDDLLIARKNGRNVADVKAQLAAEFEMKDLGELKRFLGMSNTKNPNSGISIDQSVFIRQSTRMIRNVRFKASVDAIYARSTSCEVNQRWRYRFEAL